MRDFIVAVDFDGTIVEHAFPEIGPLKSGAKKVLKMLHKKGGKIAIWTCRDGKHLDEMKTFLEAEGIPFDAINENVPGVDFTTSPKIYADVYIDNRAIGGLLSWPDIWSTLQIEMLRRGMDPWVNSW